MSERVRERFKEGDDRGKGRNVGGRGARAERSYVDVALVGYNQDILKTVDGTNGKTTCEVSGRPSILVDSEGAAPRGQRVNRRRGERGRFRCRREYTRREGGE
jgi:hypothetical protein